MESWVRGDTMKKLGQIVNIVLIITMITYIAVAGKIGFDYFRFELEDGLYYGLEILRHALSFFIIFQLRLVVKEAINETPFSLKSIQALKVVTYSELFMIVYLIIKDAYLGLGFALDIMRLVMLGFLFLLIRIFEYAASQSEEPFPTYLLTKALRGILLITIIMIILSFSGTIIMIGVLYGEFHDLSVDMIEAISTANLTDEMIIDLTLHNVYVLSLSFIALVFEIAIVLGYTAIKLRTVLKQANLGNPFSQPAIKALIQTGIVVIIGAILENIIIVIMGLNPILNNDIAWYEIISFSSVFHQL